MYNSKMSVRMNDKEKTINSTTNFLNFTIWKANLLREGIHQSFAVRFLSKIIWRVSQENEENSARYKPQKMAAFLYWFERVIDLFTKKNYKWQIDKSDGLVTYEESVRRTIIVVLTLTAISLITN